MIKTVNASPFVSAIMGATTAAILTIILIILSAWGLTFFSDPTGLIFIVPKIIQAVSALIGAIFAAKRGGNALISGAFSGIIYAIFLTIISVINSNSIGLILIMDAIIVVISILGGIIGVPKEKSNSAKRKAMMKKLKNS